MTATERFKMMFANAVERVCVLEAQLEDANATIASLEAARVAEPANGDKSAGHVVAETGNAHG